MSNLKAVHEEIEKALAATLRQRFIDAEFEEREFDERDVKIVKKNNPYGDLYLRLFIRSRQGDLDKAYKTLIDCLRWRKDSSIHDLKEDSFKDDKEVIEEGLLFYHNTDKNKNPILYFQGNKYKYKKDDNKRKKLQRLFGYLLEKQFERRLGKQILVICDHSNATMEHIDLNFFKFVANLFNIYYPNILDHFLIVDVSWRVSSAWRNIQKWLGPDISPKFKFVTKIQLTDYVDKTKLLTSLDGKDNYQYCYPPNDDTQHPFQPLFLDDVIGLNGDGTFEDAVENIDSSDEMSQGSNARSSDTIKGSPETLMRKRFSRLNNLTPHSSIEVLPTEEECEPNELVISPNEEIIFCEEENFEDVQKTLSLKNVCERKVIYKIKTNSAANFRVKPSVGWLKPGATKEVTIMLLSKAESNTEKQRHWNKNKFLILYAMHDEEISRDTSITELWKTIPKSCCKEYRLNCRILDRNGLEKRPRTIDDAIEMNLRLQKQLLELQNKMSNVTAPLETIQDQLLQQRKYFFLGISITILILMLFCFYLLR